MRKETRCRHIGYSYLLTARVLLYAPSHRQDNTYHGHWVEREKEVFYLIVIWERTNQTARGEAYCHNFMGYTLWLAARVLLYAPPHRQDSSYHDHCYTSRGMRNTSFCPSWGIDLLTHSTISRCSIMELHFASAEKRSLIGRACEVVAADFLSLSWVVLCYMSDTT